MFRQSISQKRADTVVVNETQSFTNVNGVDPVTSSHWARVVPPKYVDVHVSVGLSESVEIGFV